ncbi:hypothetical protein Taro_000901, partial [Colocasia esculenta]|nr:hypothetical protein [Colocasia esculenta]
MVCGWPGIEDPVGLPPCWCCDGSAHRDIRGGIGPLGRDLIAMRLAVAIRLSRRASRSRQDFYRGAFLPGRNRAVAVPFPVVMVSRRPWGSRQYLCCLRCFCGPGCVSACAPGQALPLEPSGRERGWLPPCVQWPKRFGVVLIVLPRLFAQCLAVEGLSRLEVVSISWDPHPREPVEGGIRATSVLELAAHVWDAEGFGVLSWHRPDSPLFHCLSLRWFRSHVVVSGVRPQLGQAVVLHVLYVLWRLCLTLVRGRRCAKHCFCFMPDSVGFCGSRCFSQDCFVLVSAVALAGTFWRVFPERFSPRLLRVVLVVVALSLCGDELPLFPVGLSLLQPAWALSMKVLCPRPCVWLRIGQLVLLVISKFLGRFLIFGVPAALAGEGLVIPTGPCLRGSPPLLLQLGARRRGSSVSDGLQRRLWHR